MIHSEAKKKYSFVSGAPGDENKSHAGGRKNIFHRKKFSPGRCAGNKAIYFLALEASSEVKINEISLCMYQ